MTDLDEFYDLAADPDEKVNRINAPEEQERIAEMRRQLYASLKEQGDPFILGGWLDRQLLENKKLSRFETAPQEPSA